MSWVFKFVMLYLYQMPVTGVIHAISCGACDSGSSVSPLNLIQQMQNHPLFSRLQKIKWNKDQEVCFFFLGTGLFQFQLRWGMCYLKRISFHDVKAIVWHESVNSSEGRKTGNRGWRTAAIRWHCEDKAEPSCFLSEKAELKLTLRRSLHWVSMTMMGDFCCRTIFQKSLRVSGSGPWVAMYSLACL